MLPASSSPDLAHACLQWEELRVHPLHVTTNEACCGFKPIPISRAFIMVCAFAVLDTYTPLSVLVILTEALWYSCSLKPLYSFIFTDPMYQLEGGNKHILAVKLSSPVTKVSTVRSFQVAGKHPGVQQVEAALQKVPLANILILHSQCTTHPYYQHQEIWVFHNLFTETHFKSA